MVKNRPLKEGYLKIDNHRIYYHTYGNPKGVPYVVLHGGPGYHSTKSSLENFNLKFEDLKRDSIIKYDQYQNTFFIDSQVVRFKIKEYKKQMYHKHSLSNYEIGDRMIFSLKP